MDTWITDTYKLDTFAHGYICVDHKAWALLTKSRDPKSLKLEVRAMSLKAWGSQDFWYIYQFERIFRFFGSGVWLSIKKFWKSIGTGASDEAAWL